NDLAGTWTLCLQELAQNTGSERIWTIRGCDFDKLLLKMVILYAVGSKFTQTIRSGPVIDRNRLYSRKFRVIVFVFFLLFFFKTVSILKVLNSLLHRLASTSE